MQVKRFILLICSILLLSSCASMSNLTEKFKAQEKANVGIFADHTITMLSEADFGFSRKEAVYLREFLDESMEEIKAIRRGRGEAAWFFGRIVDYSVKLVTIVETNDTEADRVAAYRDYVAGFNKETMVKMGFSLDRYIDIVDAIDKEKNFLGALRTAQPIINASGRYMHAVLDQLDHDLEELVAHLNTQVDAEYADVISYQEALEDEKYSVLRSFGQLYLTYKGEPDAFDKLIEEGSIRRKSLLPKGKPTTDDLSAIGEHLGKRLEALHLIGEEITPDWARRWHFRSVLKTPALWVGRWGLASPVPDSGGFVCRLAFKSCQRSRRKTGGSSSVHSKCCHHLMDAGRTAAFAVCLKM